MNSLMLLSSSYGSSSAGDAIAMLFTTILSIGGIGLLILLCILAAIIPLAVLAFTLVLNWKILVKAKEEGWKAIIPYYNLYTFYSISTNKITRNVCFFTFIGISVFSFLVGCIAAIPYLGWAVAAIVSPITMICNLVIIVAMAFLNFGLAKSLGMDTGLCVLSIFLPIVTRIMIAFGKWEYTGDKLTIFGKPDDDIPTV